MSAISRRTWLRGAASMTLALPFLEYLGTAGAFAQSTPGKKPRLLVYYLPNGRIANGWVPTASNGTLNFPAASAALQPYASRALSLVDLDNLAARNSPGAAHAMGTSTVMSGVRFPDLGGLKCSTTLDQIVAQHYGDTSRFRSLQFSAGEPGTCDVGGSPCPYTQCISWAGPGQPLIPTINPKSAFDQLFDTRIDGLEGASAELRKHTRQSVLDFVRDDAKNLEAKLGAADKARLDDYFTSLRDVERSLSLATVPDSCPLPVEGPGGTLVYQERVPVFHEVMKLAFQCDQTRVMSFMIEFGLSQRSHDFINAPGQHHAISHGDQNVLQRIETWHSEQIAHMLSLLESTPDADGGTLLDNTLVLVMPSMGAGSVHDHARVCPILFGGQGIVNTTGTQVSAAGTPLNNLHQALLEAYEIPGTFGSEGRVFGDYSTGALAGVKV